MINSIIRNIKKKITSHKVKEKNSNSQLLSTAPDPKIYNQLVNFAFNYPVNSLRYRGEHLWPYIRHHLLVQLTAISIGNIDGKKIRPSRLHLGLTENFDVLKKRELSEKYGIRFLEDIPKEDGVDFLFFTALNASEQVVLKNEIYYRIIDPLFEAAKKQFSAKKIELIRNISPAIKKTPHYFHRPEFIFSPSIVRSRFSDEVFIKDNFFTYFKRFIPSIEMNRKAILDLIDWELHTKEFYKEIFLKFQPRVIVCSSFHYHAPAISAAKELGICTVDIQHGLQVGYNPLYNNWDEIPKEGYSTIPDVFLVWGKKEADNINSVFGENATPIIIGNLWEEKQFSFGVELEESTISKTKNYSKVVLLAMQSQSEIPVLYRDLISQSDEDTLWVIRMHPKGKKYKLQEFGSTRDNVILGADINSVPIGVLLQHVNFTLSEGSSIAIEGYKMGVQALISSETGKDNYRSEIEQGEFSYISDVESFKYSVDNVVSIIGDQNKKSIDVNQVLSDVLEIQKNRNNSGRTN